MGVYAPKKALEVNGQEIYPLTHAKQVVMEDGSRLDEYLKSFSPDSSENGNGVHIGPEPPEDTSLLWVDTGDDTEDEDPLEGYYTNTETDAAIKAYVDTALGVIENGSY